MPATWLRCTKQAAGYSFTTMHAKVMEFDTSWKIYPGGDPFFEQIYYKVTASGKPSDYVIFNS